MKCIVAVLADSGTAATAVVVAVRTAAVAAGEDGIDIGAAAEAKIDIAAMVAEEALDIVVEAEAAGPRASFGTSCPTYLD